MEKYNKELFLVEADTIIKTIKHTLTKTHKIRMFFFALNKYLLFTIFYQLRPTAGGPGAFRKLWAPIFRLTVASVRRCACP